MSALLARVLIFAVPVAIAPLEEPRAHAFLRNVVRFSDAQIGSVEAGQVVTKQLPAADKPEIAAFGAVRVRGDHAEFVRRFRRDVGVARRGASILEIGRFSDPPRVEDLAGLTLDEGELDAARACKPGDCAIKLSRSAMERIRREIDGKAADRSRATDLIKRMLVEYTAAYMKGGTAEMATYADKDRPLDAPTEFRKLLAASSYLVEYVPALHAYVEAYPKGSLAGAEDLFYWTKDKFAPRPTISVYHVTIWTDPERPGVAVVASKRIYASHYFQAGLDLLAVVPAPGGGFHLMELYRARIDPPTGMLAGVILGKIRGGIEQAVAEGLRSAQVSPEAR